jgi:hypothetical protein
MGRHPLTFTTIGVNKTYVPYATIPVDSGRD